MIVLDTHVLLWFDMDSARIGKVSHRLIDEAWARDEVAVSAISFWECALLHSKGRVLLREPPGVLRAQLLESGLIEVALDGEAAIAAARLDLPVKDPADRFIVASALALDATLLTADERLLGWTGPLKRQDARL